MSEGIRASDLEKTLESVKSDIKNKEYGLGKQRLSIYVDEHNLITDEKHDLNKKEDLFLIFAAYIDLADHEVQDTLNPLKGYSPTRHDFHYNRLLSKKISSINDRLGLNFGNGNLSSGIIPSMECIISEIGDWKISDETRKILHEKFYCINSRLEEYSAHRIRNQRA